MPYKPEIKEPHKTKRKKGVLIVNLGTPENLSYTTLRKYYWQFLSDPRVVEKSPYFWKPLLQGILLQIIPFKGKKNYAKIWDTEKNASPLRVITETQTEKLLSLFSPYKDTLEIAFAMRYGTPSIEEEIDALRLKGVQEILIFPLYPHYSAATVGSVYDTVFDALKKIRFMPEIKMIRHYYTHPLYIKALVSRIQETLKSTETRPEKLLCSYHGIPKRYWEQGDPYPCHCFETTALLQEGLKETFPSPKEHILSSFQSRFGKEPWVKPYTDEEVVRLAQEGVKHLAVVSPAFASDCIETLEELDGELKDLFLQHGGKTFTRVPCLNADALHIKLMEALIHEKLDL